MSRRRSRFLPPLLALLAFLGGLAANWMPVTIPGWLQPWVWPFIILAGVATIALTIVELRQTPEPAERLVNAHEGYTDLRRRYLTRIADQTRYLPMSAVDFKAASAETGQQERQTLADVYVDLDTTTGVPVETEDDDKGQDELSAALRQRERPLTAREAVERSRRLVLLGDPGSGKSTFLNHLAFCLAADALQPEEGWIRRLDGDPQRWRRLLPVPVVLREVAAWFQATQPHQRKTGLLEAYLQHWLAQLGLEPFHEVICTHLRRGEAILLLDGLDEVPLQDDTLSRIREMIQDLPHAYPDAWMVVTCRVLSYQDRRWQLGDDWPTYELARLSADKIDRFIQAWYDQLAALHVVTHPDVRAQKLRTAVRRPDLWRLAPNPLLLTVMALVHSYKSELPEARALLYEDVVDLLLWRWEAIKLADRDGRETNWRQLLETGNITDIDMKQVFWELAFQAHRQVRAADDREATADIASSDLLQAFRLLHPEESLDWAEALVRLMQVRAGLLVESRPGVYTFPHRTFQEYLAACHLSTQPDFVEQALSLGREGAYWWEVILLAVGRLVHGGRIDGPLALVDELCLEGVTPQDEAGWRDMWLAGAVLVEIGPTRARRRNLGRELVDRVRARLVMLIQGEHLQSRERAEAGDALARLGDPRKGVGVIVRDGRSVPDIDWIPIPPGPFLMGSDRERDPDAFAEETPQFTCTRITASYRISRYPITVAQYRCFVDVGGYGEPRYWQTAFAAGHWRDGQVRVGTWNHQTENVDMSWASGPANYGEPFHLNNHPVVGVSWYEAVAFCRWLSEVLDHEVRLPSEAEWERAARHTDGRIWPWGNKFSAQKCNMRDTGIRATSTVGIFPSGRAACGALDMAGNVGEWTRSLWGADPQKLDFGYPYDPDDGRENEDAPNDVRRVVRGGSWGSSIHLVRCVYRRRANPNFRRDIGGFRVIAPGL